jgi:hypothetical protein
VSGALRSDLVQKISFNHMFGKSEILVIWHLRRVVPRRSFLPKKKVLSVKQADFRDVFKKVSKSVCTRSLYVPFDDPKYSIIWHLRGPMRVTIMEFCYSTEKDTVHVKDITANILQSQCITLQGSKIVV